MKVIRLPDTQVKILTGGPLRGAHLELTPGRTLEFVLNGYRGYYRAKPGAYADWVSTSPVQSIAPKKKTP